ncbi:hypothetical protein JR316_0012892 [Psilocybe cubensis]|uniref:Uncharacterized protein n=2 Tax=Psilocybe cubensis TaxID=181762 RepID=A0A8H8CHT9_PSICU|nr:hypothetical protein JR316_0012892 [Psilocybe cubensis]KAH9474433.1 hypothetical protein JR316_0012892 [Psilocybe cubensis]
MLLQEDTTQSSSPRPSSPAMSSKFQRKAKFRRASLSQSQSDTEFIPGISKSPSSVSAGGKEAAGSPQATQAPVAENGAATDPIESNRADFGDKDVSPVEKPISKPKEVETSVSENAMDEDQESDSKASGSKSPSFSSEMVANALVPSPDPPHSTVLPEESSKQEDAGGHIQESPEAHGSPPPPDISPGADRMRPFSPEELSQAKLLVLDLLGWGVEPEFLVTSGVSAEALYRIFTDLNLRLPHNLEVSEDVKAVAYSWGPVPGVDHDSDMDSDIGATQSPPFAQSQAVE